MLYWQRCVRLTASGNRPESMAIAPTTTKPFADTHDWVPPKSEYAGPLLKLNPAWPPHVGNDEASGLAALRVLDALVPHSPLRRRTHFVFQTIS